MSEKKFKDLVVGDKVKVVWDWFLQCERVMYAVITKIEEVDEKHRKIFFKDCEAQTEDEPEFAWTVYNDADYDFEGDAYDSQKIIIL